MHKDLVQYVNDQEIEYGKSEQTESLLNRLSSWGVELKKEHFTMTCNNK